MNMMQMVGIMVGVYFVTLLLISLYHNIINVKIANTVFIAIDLFFFLAWNYAAYQKGWLKDGFMTLENISPFIMTLIPLTLFMNEKVKSFCNSAIAFLWMGMFIALMVSPQHAYIFNYNIEATFIYASEAACHLIASLYGFYLILTKQVRCDFEHWVKSIVCMLSVIGFGVALNYIFHLDNFGMDPYGSYSIYMLDIFGSFPATLVAYCLGVTVVLTVGMQSGMGLIKLVDSVHRDKKQENQPSADCLSKASAEKAEEKDGPTSEKSCAADAACGFSENSLCAAYLYDGQPEYEKDGYKESSAGAPAGDTEKENSHYEG